MFGVDSSEFMVIVLVAIIVIGPKDLPRVMRTVGHWIGKARGMANQFRSGVDQMVRESEIAELEQKWREQNEAIMRANPNAAPVSDWGVPKPEPVQPADGGIQPMGASARPAPTPPGNADAVTPPRLGKTPPPDFTEAPKPRVAATTDLRKPPAAPPPLIQPAVIAPPRGADFP